MKPYKNLIGFRSLQCLYLHEEDIMNDPHTNIPSLNYRKLESKEDQDESDSFLHQYKTYYTLWIEGPCTGFGLVIIVWNQLVKIHGRLKVYKMWITSKLGMLLRINHDFIKNSIIHFLTIKIINKILLLLFDCHGLFGFIF